MARHKWNGKICKINSEDGRTSNTIACVKCGCVKELIDGKPTYFINDSCYDKAPNCDERLLKASGYDSLEEIILMQG